MVPEKIFEGFFTRYGRGTLSMSFDPDAANKLLFPLPIEAPHKILTLIDQAVLEKKVFEHYERRQRRTSTMDGDGRRSMDIL